MTYKNVSQTKIIKGKGQSLSCDQKWSSRPLNEMGQSGVAERPNSAGDRLSQLAEVIWRF
jgi:hypothetical protein